MSESKKPARSIGGYEIGRLLGHGLTSRVYLGTHSETRGKVALKVMMKDKMKEKPNHWRALETELASLGKLKHANILNLIKCDRDAKFPDRNEGGIPKDVALMVLELAPNGELLDFLMHTGSFSEDVARTYFTQLTSALSACHAIGVVHRDLKPDNLLLDANFQLKVADFGFASSSNIMQTYVGTEGYMAPEVVRMLTDSSTSYTQACDVWSSGVVLFIMYMGLPPYSKPNKCDWWFDKLTSNQNLFWKAHKQQRPDIPPDFQDLIGKMLSDPAKDRATLSEIKEHKWVRNRKILTQNELKKELERKKPLVDEGKDREALEAKNASSSMGTRGGLTGSRRAINQVNMVVELKDLPKPILYDDSAIKCYTVLHLGSTPKHAVQQAVQLLSSMGPGTKYTREGYSIEAHVQDTRGLVQVSVQVFSATSHEQKVGKFLENPAGLSGEDDVSEVLSGGKSQGTSTVEIRRLSGPWVEFRRVFGYFKQSLR